MEKLSGFYHDNYKFYFNGQPYILRIPIENAKLMDIKIIPEWDVLKYLNQYTQIINNPEPIHKLKHKGHTYCVYSYKKGNLLDNIHPHPNRVNNKIVIKIATQMANLHSIEVPPHFNPPWKESSVDFYSYLFEFVSNLIEQYKDKYTTLHAFPSRLHDFKAKGKLLTNREFVICHCDIHRKNILIDGDAVNILDWELALVADPLYDIAVHFHRMKYDVDQELLFMENYLKKYNIHQSIENIFDEIGIYRDLEEIKSMVINQIDR